MFQSCKIWISKHTGISNVASYIVHCSLQLISSLLVQFHISSVLSFLSLLLAIQSFLAELTEVWILLNFISVSITYLVGSFRTRKTQLTIMITFLEHSPTRLETTHPINAFLVMMLKSIVQKQILYNWRDRGLFTLCIC